MHSYYTTDLRSINYCTFVIKKTPEKYINVLEVLRYQEFDCFQYKHTVVDSWLDHTILQ